MRMLEAVGARRRIAMYALAVLPFVFAEPGLAQSAEDQAKSAERAARRREELEERMRRIVAQFTSTIRETAAMVDRLGEMHATATKRMQELMKSDDGKRIGRDAATLMALVRGEDEPPVTGEQIAARRSAIQSLLTGMENELKRDAVGYLPEDATRRELDEILFWTRDRMSRLTEREAWLDDLLAKTPRDVDVSREPTLEERIRGYRAEIRRAANEAAAAGDKVGRQQGSESLSEAARIAALEKAQAESQRLLRESRAETERMKLDYELRLKQLEQERAREAAEAEIRYKDAMAELERAQKAADAKRALEDTEADAEAGKVMAEAERKKLQARCEDPEVKRLLAPFTEPGYFQPRGRGIDKKPMSLQALKDSGALGTDEKSLRVFWKLSSQPENDRPHFDFPTKGPFNLRHLSGEQIETLKKARDCLRELGPTLVELGKLSP